MAEIEITDLTAATVLADADLIPVVDVSDTSQAPSGTNKGATVELMRTAMRSGTMLYVASSEAPADVKDRCDYVCDGTADQTEINTALAASTGGVMLSGGTFNVTAPITVQEPGQLLCGTGRYQDRTADGIGIGLGTRIKVATGFSGAAAVLVQSTSATVCLDRVTLRDMTVDGNSIAGPVDGVRFRAYQASISNLEVQDCTGEGLHIKGYTSGVDGVDWATYDTRIYDVHCLNNDGAGIRLSNNAADLHIAMVVCHGNVYGIRVASSSPQFTQFHCYENSFYGVWLEGGAAARVKMVNGKIEHSGRHGLYCDGSSGSGQTDTQIIGVGFNCNGKTTDNTYNHIQIEGNGAFWNSIIGFCAFGNSDSVANTPKEAIAVASQAQYCTFVGNVFGSNNGGAHTTFFVPGAVSSTCKFIGNVGIPDISFQEPAFATSFTPDCALGETVDVATQTGNVTINAPINAFDGAHLHIWLTQDATGGRTVTFNAVFHGVTAAVTTANVHNIWHFVYNGSIWIQMSANVGVA